MDDEDGRCLLDVICDPQALNDFLHGSETHLDADDLLDGSADPSSSFFSNAGGLVPVVQTSTQLSASVPAAAVPGGSVDLDFLEDADILGGSPGGGGGAMGGGEPCDILQQSLAEANITEQSLQEAEAELDLAAFAGAFPGLTDPAGAAALGMGVGVGVGAPAQIFPAGPAATPPGASQDAIGPVLAHPGLHLQQQMVNKAINMQPFMQQMGLGNVTLQSIPGLQALPNGAQPGHLGIGHIQVVGQPTVMTINQSGQPILAKAVGGGYHLHQPGPEAGAAAVLSSPGGGGLLIQGGKAVNGAAAVVGVSSASTAGVSSSALTGSSAGLLGFGGLPLGPPGGVAVPQQPKTLNQAPLMQNVIIQRTPTPIQPKPPQGGVIQPRPPPAAAPSSSLQNDGGKGLQAAQQQAQVPVSSAQNVAFLTGKPGGNMVLSTQAGPQGTPFPQALFKQQSLHLLNQPGGGIVLQGQNPQFLLPQLQAGGQILTQHPGGHHIITSQGPGGQLIANQILAAAAGQNLNLGQVLSGHFQLQPGQLGHPALFQMPVSLAQTQAHPGAAQTVIQGMPVQNSLAMLSQVEGLGPAVTLQAGGSVAPAPPPPGGQCQPGEDQAALPAPPPSILTVQTATSISVPTSSLSSSSPASSCSSSSSSGGGAPPPMAAHSPGKLLLPQGSGMILSHESLQMFLQQEQQRRAESASPPSGCAPASVIVSGSAVPAPSPRAWPGQSSAHTVDPSGEAAVVYQFPGHQQQPKVVGMSPSHPLVTHAAPSALPQTDGPQQPLQPSPLTLSQQIQSPHHQRPPSEPPPQIQIQAQQPLSRPPSRSCTPSSSSSSSASALPSLFIIHNQIGGSPQHAPQAPPQVFQQQQQPPPLQAQSRPPSQPAPFQPDAPPSSSSPKPPQAPAAQFLQFAAHPAGTKQQVPLLSLTQEQQNALQLVSTQLQTLSAIAQPSPQQKQLLDRLHQVQHSIILQARQQAQVQLQAQLHAQTQAQSQTQPLSVPSSQFGPQQDPPAAQAVTSSAGADASASILHQTSVLVKTPAAVSSEVKVFPGGPGGTVVSVGSGVAPVSHTQSTQATQGLISSVGALPAAKGGLQVVTMGTSQTSTPPQPPAPTQTQTTTLKMPFSMMPSKEARMLEQLRKQQGSVLRPDCGSPFRSHGDVLQRLIPYHLYQGTPSSLQDYCRVDTEFESVSSQLLKRTQAMLDKYRLLLFEESKRLGPSAEMVMIDRMFIQEEKVALSQDRVLAKERPDEYTALQNPSGSAPLPSSTESSAAKPATSVTASLIAAPVPIPAPGPPQYPPTKLVIKQEGVGASVSWCMSSAPSPAARQVLVGQAPPPSSAPASSRGGDEDDDALPQRSSRPPMKTYEARGRIGLKLKIKQEAGLSKVVHNTALDPVHSQPQPQPRQRSPPVEQQPPPPSTATAEAIIRTPPRPATSDPMSAIATAPALPAGPAQVIAAPPPSSLSSSLPSSSSSSSSSTAASSTQMNGTLEHREVGGAKQNPAHSTPTPPITCRLPLRKTYRANVSPPVRPGVVGGGGPAHLTPRPPVPPLRLSPASSSPPGRTVIASVKVEDRGGSGPHPQTLTNANAGGAGGGGGGPNAASNAQCPPPGFMQEVEEAFYRGIIKNRHRPREQAEEEEGAEQREEGVGPKRAQGGRGGKIKERPSVAPPSPGGSPCSWDSLLPTKRRKSDSPDVDNASFSSGSPPPDDSLNEHLQSAIDSILNLQQGPLPPGGGAPPGRGQRQVAGPYRPAAPSGGGAGAAGAAAAGDFSARGRNGKLVPQTHDR